jgi:hypothetical protein
MTWPQLSYVLIISSYGKKGETNVQAWPITILGEKANTFLELRRLYENTMENRWPRRYR